MLSGIGDADELARFDIPAVVPSAGGRRQPPGPPRDLRPARLHQADLAVRGAKALEQAVHRPRMAPAQARPRRHQPFRGGRVHPLARGRRAPRSAVPFPAARGELRRLQPAADPRLPGARRADAPDLGRPHPAARRRSARAALDPVQLHGHRGRPPGDARGGAPDPRDLRPARVRSLPRPGARARPRGRDRRRDRCLRARPRRERLSRLRHLQDGPGQRPERGGRRRLPGLRRRGPARRRRLDHAEHRVRQPQRADDHARREGLRPDPRPRAARCRLDVRSTSRRTGRPSSGSQASHRPTAPRVR